MENRKVKRMELCNNCVLNYWAGFFDGEGTIYISKHKINGKYINYFVDAAIVNSYKPVLEEIQQAFGGTIRHAAGKNKHLWLWTIRANQAVEFLETMLPFLQVKGKQARLAIEFQRNRPKHTGRRGRTKEQTEWLEAMILKMKELNKSGKHVANHKDRRKHA